MKNLLGIILIAFATLISFTRSCKNTTKAINSIENANLAYTKYASNIEVNYSTKSTVKAVSNVKTSTDLYKLFADSEKDTIQNLKPK